MACWIRIDPASIKGIGGSPIPATIEVKGTLSGCEYVRVKGCGSETEGKIIHPPAGSPPGTPATWIAEITNVKPCQCNSDIDINVTCHNGSSCSDHWSGKLVCDEECPIAVFSFSEDQQCVAGKRSVTLNATVTAPSSSSVSGGWDYGDGTLGPPFYVTAGATSALPSTTHPYSPPGPYTATLVLSKPPSPPRCQDPSISFSVTSCPSPICPTLTLKPPQVTGCAPTNAVVTFNIDQLQWPPGSSPIPPTHYLWTVEGPTGLSYKKVQNSTAGTVTSIKSSDIGWTGSGATSAGTVDLSQHGTYTITVTAEIPGLSPTITCNATDTIPFLIPHCPPTVISCTANANTGTFTITFSEDVDSISATTPGNFTVTVNRIAQTLTASQLAYTPNTTTITGLTIPAGATVSVTVINVTDKAGNVIVANGRTNACSTMLTTTPPTTTPPTTTPPTIQPPILVYLCLILLIVALALIAIAAIALLAWACSGFAHNDTLAVGIVAAFFGLGLLIVWIFVCAALQCAALFVMIDTFTGLVIAMPIVAVILAILKLDNCGLGALIDCGFFGIVLSALYKFGEIVGCILRKS